MKIQLRAPKKTQIPNNKKHLEFDMCHPCIGFSFPKMKNAWVINLRQAMNAKLNSNSSSKNNIF